MFVQVNPDASSYSETLSTLKFAERVSTIELGSAKSNKEGKEVRDLMELVSFIFFSLFLFNKHFATYAYHFGLLLSSYMPVGTFVLYFTSFLN